MLYLVASVVFREEIRGAQNIWRGIYKLLRKYIYKII